MRFWIGSALLAAAACRVPEPVDAPDPAGARLLVSELAPGALVITEIMADPPGSDNPQEWFEILNLSGDEVDLDGLVVAADGGSFTVGGTTLVPAGGYFVFGESADAGVNGGYTPDYAYGTTTLNLANGGTTLAISHGTTTIDTVTYGADATWPDEEGHALSLDDDALDATSNDTGSNWCDSYGSTYGPDMLVGTPGAANPDCAASDVDQDGYVSCAWAPGDGCDCDDYNAAINPGATEDAVDLVDDDCDGYVAASPDTLVAGSLVLTEVLINPTPTDDGQREWFEFRVDHPVAVDLFDLRVEGYLAGTTDPEGFTVDQHILAQPGDYIVFGVQDDVLVNGNVQVDYDWPAPPDGFNLFNGSDLLELRTPSDVLIDGIAWDNGATFPDPEGATIVLEPTLSTHTANDDGSNWCVANVPWDPPASDLGSPGQPNQTCLDRDGDGRIGEQFGGDDCNDDDPGIHPGIPEVEDNGVDEDCDGFDAFVGGAALLPGDVVITEIQKEPTAIADGGPGANGEWFEVLNTSGNRIDLRNVDFTMASSYTFTLDQFLVLDPGEYALFARNSDPLVNGGIPTADIDYDTPAGWGMDNDTDTLTLSFGATTIDAVTYDTSAFPDIRGAALSLEPSLTNSVDNDAGSSWCDAYTAYGTIPDQGTPGTANPICIDRDVDGDGSLDAAWSSMPSAADDCEDRNPAVNPGVTEIDDDGIDQDCDGFDSQVVLDDLVPGDLVITEIMIDPDPLANSNGEWFEIYNDSPDGVDLKGLVIVNDRGESDTIVDFAYVPAGGRALVVQWDVQADNGELPYSYPSSAPTRYHHELLSFVLYNGDLRLSIESPDGTELDAVAWDGGPGFPDPQGSAIQLEPIARDAVLNDDGANWCISRDTYGSPTGPGLYGTPLAENHACAFSLELHFYYTYNDPTPGDLTDDGPGDFDDITTVTFTNDGMFTTGNFGQGVGGNTGTSVGQSLSWTYDSTGVEYSGSRSFGGGGYAGSILIPPTLPGFWPYYTGTWTATEVPLIDHAP